MSVRTAAVLLLLVLHFSQANRTNDKRNQNPDTRSRRHDSEERTSSGRRWTTSRNSPYQKIVSSYEQEDPDLKEESSEQVETSTSEDPDQAKAKSHKRKHSRTSASSHDEIPSEKTSGSESEKDDSESDDPNVSDVHSAEVQQNQTPSGSASRRRSTTTSHAPEMSTEPSTASSKKRRRPATTSATTTTLAPQTMSDSLYQYFRPLEQDVPQDDIIPFLDFGRKLSPVIPTPSGVNSIENKSSITKLKPRNHYEEKENIPSDEEILQEDMDVTVVKKAIERNSVPRGKLRVREQGISDYYRKRVPAQVRTTENLISTSDSSTASSVSVMKNAGTLKKSIRHQIHNLHANKPKEQVSHKFSPEQLNTQTPQNVEMLQEKRRILLSRPIQRSAALKQEHSLSPLTAESSLVKTVIRDLPKSSRVESESSSTISMPNYNSNTSKYVNNPNSSLSLQVNNNSSQPKLPVTNLEIQNSKILSTAVVTSVSVQEILKDAQGKEANTSKETIANKNYSDSSTIAMQLHPSTVSTKNTSYSVTTAKSLISFKNTTHLLLNNSSKVHDIVNKPIANKSEGILKKEASLRSREIYRPKHPPLGISIPHLPRQIPIHIPIVNVSPKIAVSPERISTTTTSEIITKTTLTTSPPTPSKTTLNTSPPTPSTTPSTTTSKMLSSNFEPTTTLQTDFVKQDPVTVLPKAISTTENDDLPEKRVYNTTVSTEDNLYQNLYLTTTEVQEPTPSEDDNSYNITTLLNNGDEEYHRVSTHQPSILSGEDYTWSPGNSVPEERSKNETVGNVSIAPVYSPEYETEEQFPIYFTTLPTATVPLVDTRPDTEAAVVEEQQNITTSPPGAEWVNVGAVNKDVEVLVHSNPESPGVGTYLLAALGVVPIILGALVGARFIMAHNKKKVLDESEYSSEYNRSPLGASAASPLPTKLPRIPTHVSWAETEKNAPVITPVTPASARWEFSRDKLRLQTLLGQGNFGQVWKAEADDIAGHEGLTRLVAVKTVKESANVREREDLLRELGIMQELGSHPNVVTLLGCCTEKEPIYLIMEYVMYGKLLSFLRDHRTRAHYYNFSDASDALTSRDLTVFAYCVARGMDYLTNKSIIHRDLAARNVLVDHNKLCKIADFGMSRNVRDTGQIYEQRQSKGALPIRWMAPESLHFSLFTHKTDVWSFGILMWEIVTLGSTPYATMGAREVMRRVRDGYRLDRPSHCRSELFRVIAKCWHSEPSKRPTFAELKVELGQLLSDSELNGSYVDLDSFADEMRRDTLHRHH